MRLNDGQPHLRPRQFFALLAAMVMPLCWPACTAKHYRKAADSDVYRIVQQAERDVFGTTNSFTIDTEYSSRKPESITPGELIDDRARTNRGVLTIDEALDLATNNSRRYRTEKERLYLTALSLTGDRYSFSPQFFLRPSAGVERDSAGDVSSFAATRAGLGRAFQSGGSIGLSLANDILRYYTGDPRRSVISTLSINLVQPLLRGFGRNSAAAEALTQAQRNVIYAVRNYGFFQNEFSVEIVNDYFDLLAQKDIIRNRYTNYLGRVQSTKRLAARADRDRLSDVDQARQAELNAKNNYVNAVASYQTSLDQFKIKLGLPLGDRVLLDDQPLGEMRAAGLVPANLDAEAAYRFAVERQLQILNAIDQFEDLKRKIRIAANRLKADIDVFAEASLDSDGPTDYTSFDPDQIRAAAGIELDLPIDRLVERNNYRATLVSFEAELRNLTLALDSLKDSIERGIRTLEQRRQNFEIQMGALELANRRVLGSTLRLQAGIGEVREMVESQDAQIAAQNAVTTALVSYQEARLQLMLDIGTLETGSPKFWLKDHTVAFFPDAVPVTPAPDLLERPLIPPDQFFNN